MFSFYLNFVFLAGGQGVFNLSNAMEMFPSLTNQDLSARSQVGCNTWIQFNKRSSFEKGKASSKQPIFVKYKNTSSIFWSVIQKIRCYHLIFVLSWWVFFSAIRYKIDCNDQTNEKCDDSENDKKKIIT